MADVTPGARRRSQRVGDTIKLDNVHKEAAPEGAPANTMGLVRNFVRCKGSPKWGALHAYDTLANLKANVGAFQVNEPGHHAVQLVYFDKGADGQYRFVQIVTDEIHVAP